MRGQRVLVVVQIALSIALLAGAGLMLRSFFNLRQEAVGFSVDHVLTAQLALPRLRYGEAPLIDRFFRDLTRRLAAEPGVVAVGATSNLPFAGTSFDLDGSAPRGGRRSPAIRSPSRRSAPARRATSRRSAFRCWRAGSSPRGTRRRRRWSRWSTGGSPTASGRNQDPLGRRLRLGPPDVPPELRPSNPGGRSWASVGNVRDGGPAVPPSSEGTVYFPLPSRRSAISTWRSAPREEIPWLSAASCGARCARSIMISRSPTSRPWNRGSARCSARQRLSTILLASFGILALALASLGALLGDRQTVARRHREIAIRMALVPAAAHPRPDVEARAGGGRSASAPASSCRGAVASDRAAALRHRDQ